jgi:chaperonin cofactor prefoldin
VIKHQYKVFGFLVLVGICGHLMYRRLKKDEVETLSEENTDLDEKVCVLKKENEKVVEENSELKKEVEQKQAENDELKSQSE